MAEFGWDFQKASATTSSKQGQMLSAVVKQVLNILKDGGSTTSPGSLFNYLTTPTVRSLVFIIFLLQYELLAPLVVFSVTRDN